MEGSFQLSRSIYFKDSHLLKQPFLCWIALLENSYQCNIELRVCSFETLILRCHRKLSPLLLLSGKQLSPLPFHRFSGLKGTFRVICSNLSPCHGRNRAGLYCLFFSEYILCTRPQTKIDTAFSPPAVKTSGRGKERKSCSTVSRQR